MEILFALLQEISVFLVIGYLFSKTPAFKALSGEILRTRQKLLLYVVFSVFSILGTYFGLPVQDAVANTRAIGAVLGGIIGGPVLGLAVGFTGGLHRYSLGGFVAFPAMLATAIEGLIGGLVHLWLVRNNQTERIFSPAVACCTTLCSEAVHMLILAGLGRPQEESLALVRTIALPMIAANSLGTFLFMSVLRDRKNMVDRLGVLFSARAFKVAERTLGILDKGLDQRSAARMVDIIYQETGVSAVGITDTERILAFAGIGSDHHRAGMPITSDMTRQAISSNEVIFADGIHRPYQCSVATDCPLGSTLVVPLYVDNEVVGAIKLYERKSKLFLNINRTLGEGIASLLSNQLLKSRYQQQKNLLLQSELKLLQAQINPHFLFNTLNTIIAIIRKDADRARDLLLHLSNFFRKNLKRASDFSTLAEELDHVNSYLKIEKARFEDKLQVEQVIDEALLPLRLPTFTLQPIIENAVKHGISTMIGQGLVRIVARREEDEVVIEIEDNAGSYCEEIKEGGLGMHIVDQRIKNLYGSQYGLRVACFPQEATRIAIHLPRERKGQP